VTHARADRTKEAEEKFLKAISIERTFLPAQFDLGVLYYKTGSDQKALRLFEMVEHMDPERARVYFYQGVILRRTGKVKEGDDELEKALALDPTLASEINFLRGAALLQAGKHSAARESLQGVITLTPEVELADSARALLAQIESPSDQQNRFRLHASFGLQYDDNVILEPRSASASPSGITEQSDFVGVLYFLAKYQWLRLGDWRGDLKYSYFLNFHQDSSLTDFDVQDNHLSASLGRRFGLFESDLEYEFQLSTLAGDAFLLAQKVRPRFMVYHSERQITELVYSFGSKEFKDIPLLFPTNSDRDVKAHFGRISHYRNFAQSATVYGTVLYEKEDAGDSATEDDWIFDGYGIHTAVVLPPWRKITPSFEVDWRNCQYKNLNQLAPTIKREDNDLLLLLTLSRPLNEALDLAVQYLYQINDSNIAAFEYRRNIVGLILTAKYI